MESRSTKQSLVKNIDWVTIVIYLVMIACGIVSIYAASYDFDNASIFDFNEFSGKQIRWVGLSFIIGLVILVTDYRLFETYAYPIYLGFLLLLLITIFIAPNINGSHSWIVLGPMSLQPAEFAKFATALALAKTFGSYNFSLNSPANYAKVLLIIFLPILLILAQNETGSALVYMSLFFVLYREGMSGLILFAALLIVVTFVVTIKYTATLILGIPSGEFFIFLLIMATLVFMLAFYCKRIKIAQYVFLLFVFSGIIITILSLCNVRVPGRIYFISILIIACLYSGFEMLKLKSNKILMLFLTRTAKQ